jgi:hypothetical protein
LLGAEKRWRPASDVDCIKGVEVAPVHHHLFEESIQKIGKGRKGGGRIEVAIRAFAQAKRNVNVESGSLF